jgi:hypothetical protein
VRVGIAAEASQAVRRTRCWFSEEGKGCRIFAPAAAGEELRKDMDLVALCEREDFPKLLRVSDAKI